MEFPTEFSVAKIVFTVNPKFIETPPAYESTPLIFEVGTSASGWFGSGTGVSLTKEDMLDAAIEGFKHMSAKLAEYSTRDDVFLHADSVNVAFYGDASQVVVFDLTPEEEPEE